MDDDFQPQGNVSGPGPDGSGGDVGRGAGAGGTSAGAAGTTGARGNAAGPASATCDDGWMNGNETGTDCGAQCAPCACAGEFATPDVLITGLGTSGSFYGPALWRDNQTLYFSRNLGGDENLYETQRSDRGSTFSNPEALAGLNTASLDGSPYVTPDGLTLYFFSDREGGPGDRDLWSATRASTSADFVDAEVLAVVNSTARDYFPWLTPDRLGLLFVSDRAGGQGKGDIWLAERSTPAGLFSAPRNLSELNTSEHEGGMTLSRDGLTILFVSRRAGGQGDTDLWMASRVTSTGRFSAPSNVAVLNSTVEEDDPKLSSDGREIFFSSTRDGQRHLWRALRSCD